MVCYAKIEASTHLVSKSTRFISFTLPDNSPRAWSIKPRISSGASLSGVISEYHKSTTKSLKILSVKLSKAATTEGEPTFHLHLETGSTVERRWSLADNCFFDTWDKYVCFRAGCSLQRNSTLKERYRRNASIRIDMGTFVHIDLLVSIRNKMIWILAWTQDHLLKKKIRRNILISIKT